MGCDHVMRNSVNTGRHNCQDNDFDRFHSALHFLFRDQPGEVFKGTVVGLFGFRREKARRQLTARQVRVQAIATYAMFATGISTGAFLFVRFDFAFHDEILQDRER